MLQVASGNNQQATMELLKARVPERRTASPHKFESYWPAKGEPQKGNRKRGTAKGEPQKGERIQYAHFNVTSDRPIAIAMSCVRVGSVTWCLCKLSAIL